MKKLLIVSMLSLSVQSNAQYCNIGNAYSDFIRVKKITFDESQSIVVSCAKINDTTCYAPLVNAPLCGNYQYIDELLHTFSTIQTHDLSEWEDTIAIEKEYFLRLQMDSVFHALLNEWTDKTINNTLKKDVIHINTLMDIAVKYFMIQRINNEGHFVGKVCSEINLIASTQKVRKPFMETFCIVTILNYYDADNEFNTKKILIDGLKSLYPLNFGLDKEERLLRAQGAMCMSILHNENLRQLLIKEYEENKESLPFILKY